MAAHQASRPQPMNASPDHPKVKVQLTMGSPLHVAGGYVAGKLEVECRTDKGLGIEVMMVELFAIQELTSRDHSATSTFLHTRRLFQGPGLPPSNAVQPFPQPGDPALPPNYHQARRGISTYLFRFPIPASSPSSINFGGGLATLKYDVRASVGVFWKGEKKLVTDRKEVDVVESCDLQAIIRQPEPEAVVVGENGKVWAQGRIVNGMVVAGESACVELQVKNHSTKKNTGLTVSLTRSLYLCLPSSSGSSPPPSMQISDTIISIPFKSAEYIIPSGAEGVASLVFDVPKYARGVKGGIRESDLNEGRRSEPLFEVRCVVNVKIGMGIGSKDILLEIPVKVVHPLALPEFELPPAPYHPHHTVPSPVPSPYHGVPSASPYALLPQQTGIPYVAPYMAPPYDIPPPMSPQPYIDNQNQVWFAPPPPQAITPNPYYQQQQQQGYYTLSPPAIPPRQLPSPPSQQVAESEPLKIITNDLPVPTGKLSVVSPRPVLSPRLSYTNINSTDDGHANASVKSDRVEQLEKLAEVVGVGDLSSSEAAAAMDVEEADTSVDLNKTLPVPPVPSTKGKGKEKETRPKINTFFEEKSNTLAVSSTESKPPSTPPTPTLTAVTPGKKSSQKHLNLTMKQPVHAKDDNAESGLDALERRLLMQVGTRKPPPVRAPDVRDVLATPTTGNSSGNDLKDDSAISSLTLGNEMDGIMANIARNSRERKSEERERSRERDSDTRTHRGGETRKVSDPSGRKKKTKEREREKGQSSRSAASKGRVAAWLGGVEPDVKPEEPILLADPAIETSPVAAPQEVKEEETLPSVPNPRSSGFVDIATFKRETFQRQSIIKNNAVELENRRVMDIWSDRNSDTPTAAEPAAPITTPAAEAFQEPTIKAIKKNNIFKSPRLVDPEVKYDVRSARGGRGGKVTAVASLWAAGVDSTTKTPPPVKTKLTKSPLSFAAVAAKKTPPKSGASTPRGNTSKPETNIKVGAGVRPGFIKSTTSVPASVSSSHATPTLSSTASLARPFSPPVARKVESKAPRRTMSSVVEHGEPSSSGARTNAEIAKLRNVLGSANESVAAAAVPSLAFGQARLRDLIKKYQGAAST